jgi:hypothetical protein
MNQVGAVVAQVGFVIAMILVVLGLGAVAFTVLMGIAFQSSGSNK